jgi:steroid 5-alpha reductase family enzyme
MKIIILLNGTLSDISGILIQNSPLLTSSLTVMIAAALLCFVVSEITRNYSQVDKLWSLMPIVYSIMALAASPSPRIWIMVILVTAWGLRLSYNFGRKGGYSIIPWKGGEDYRWHIMRNNPALKGRLRFGLFNLFFISFYQHFLIFLFSTPLIIAAQNNNTSLNFIDILAAAFMLVFLLVETTADNQLFRFHTIKKGTIPSGGLYTSSLEKGFMTEGLFRFVRHPNFASEQGIWISFYFFGVAASANWLNWTIAGPVLLVLLFAGSSELTERISSSKYPAYSEYKKKVPRFLPDLSSIFKIKSN